MTQEAAVEEFVVDQGDGDPEAILPETEIEPREGDMEIVIEDDTPEVDQGRDPLPREALDDLELEDDAKNYSKNVQSRMNKLKKAYHDERREKESMQRELEESTNATRYFMSESQKKDMAFAQQATIAVNYEMEKARESYQEAFDDGDAEAVSKAQQQMNQIGIRKDKLDRYNQQNPQGQQRQPIAKPQQQAYAQQQKPPKLDEATESWVGNNKWFGPKGDHEMTSTAMGIHEELVDDGFREGSPEYFKRIDARMRTRFPEKFGGHQQPSTVVVPSSRQLAGKKVVLTETQVKVARDLGITLQQYANGVAKMQRGNS